MSRESIEVWRMTWAGDAAGTGAAALRATPSTGGCTSRSRRWRVQSPPRITLVGIPGSGTMEPNSAPPPTNLNPVT